MAKTLEKIDKKKTSTLERSDNREIIISELQRYGRRQKQAGAWRMIICPFHKGGQERTPSCGVNLSSDRLGVWNCLGCTEKGSWNKLAKKAGLAEIKEWRSKEVLDAGDLLTSELDESLLGSTAMTFGMLKKKMGYPEATLWPEFLDWRGFPGTFMRKLGAHIISERPRSSGEEAEFEAGAGIAVLFPVKVAGQLRGGIKALFTKKKGSRASSYYASKGSWVSEYGLFPYIYAKSLVKKENLPFIILVEGPRDAMRLCLNGIPAVAVLGSKNVTKKKIQLLTGLDIEIIYVMPDNDDGGKLMWKLCKSLAPKTFPIKRIKLPRQKDADGNLIKMDPGNMPRKLLKQVAAYLSYTHSFDMPKHLK